MYNDYTVIVHVHSVLYYSTCMCLSVDTGMYVQVCGIDTIHSLNRHSINFNYKQVCGWCIYSVLKTLQGVVSWCTVGPTSTGLSTHVDTPEVHAWHRNLSQ